MGVALVVIALVLFLARKPLARAIKRYIKRKRAAVRLYLKRLAHQVWVATKVQVARRTVGGLA